LPNKKCRRIGLSRLFVPNNEFLTGKG
jgi:hypothetical protein